MDKKSNNNRMVTCKLVWKKRIISEKGVSEKYAEQIVEKSIKLTERMLYGHAMIAFYKQDGTFCMEEGTLVGYDFFFRRRFTLTPEQESIVYWSIEQQAWRRFRIGNLLEWKAIV